MITFPLEAACTPNLTVRDGFDPCPCGSGSLGNRQGPIKTVRLILCFPGVVICRTRGNMEKRARPVDDILHPLTGDHKPTRGSGACGLGGDSGLKPSAERLPPVTPSWHGISNSTPGYGPGTQDP